jgi:hypothetical protein
MPMFVRRDRNIDWRIWDAWAQATVGPTSIVRVHGELVVDLPREAVGVVSSVP